MAWVKIIPAEHATGELKRAYELRGVDEGTIRPPYEGLTNNGAILGKLIEFSDEVMYGPSPLTRLQREMIATHVSAINQCVF
jgi:alkylhydroperoxidase family enzyme